MENTAATNAPRTDKHSRGVARSQDSFDGLAAYRLFDEGGRLVAQVHIVEDCADPYTESLLRDLLDHCSPNVLTKNGAPS